MRIVQLTPGAGGMYCGNCLRDNALVAALPSCIGPTRPARYPAITTADYVRERLDATYAHRRRPGQA